LRASLLPGHFVSQDRYWRGTENKPDTFLHGASKFLLATGHFGFLASVYHVFRDGSVPDGGTHAVHCRVPASQHDDALAADIELGNSSWIGGFFCNRNGTALEERPKDCHPALARVVLCANPNKGRTASKIGG
jgi:hypothetical protein